MRFFLRAHFVLTRWVFCLPVILFGSAVVACAQAPAPAPRAPGAASAPHAPVPRKQYCQPDGGFCFKYPASWIVLGEIFKGHGVVVAPVQKQDRTLWNAVTIALVVPPPEGGDESMSLDGAIEEATAGLREAGQDFETLQRQTRTVDHKPAEMLKVRYHEKSSGVDWVEELVFIEGPESEIYSVGLKTSPADMARMESSFAAVVASWNLPEPAVPDTPSQSAPPPGTQQEAPKQAPPNPTPPAAPKP